MPRRSGPGSTKPAWNAVLRAHGVRSGRGYGVSGCRSVRTPRSRQIATSLVFFPMLLRRSRVDGALAGPYSIVKRENFLCSPADWGWERVVDGISEMVERAGNFLGVENRRIVDRDTNRRMEQYLWHSLKFALRKVEKLLF